VVLGFFSRQNWNEFERVSCIYGLQSAVHLDHESIYIVFVFRDLRKSFWPKLVDELNDECNKPYGNLIIVDVD
jgi:hypothetical protein